VRINVANLSPLDLGSFAKDETPGFVLDVVSPAFPKQSAVKRDRARLIFESDGSESNEEQTQAIDFVMAEGDFPQQLDIGKKLRFSEASGNMDQEALLNADRNRDAFLSLDNLLNGSDGDNNEDSSVGSSLRLMSRDDSATNNQISLKMKPREFSFHECSIATA
jgi:hypothetical protein